ncbi:MAG: hypothetical protein K2P95_05395 [Hyphomonadaceae bacterium]|nr:hypothetical protein [Hyphomonadaceae bacterium]
MLLQLSLPEFDRISSLVAAALAPAEPGPLATEVLGLIACCQRPPEFDEDRAQAYIAGVMDILRRHPAAVAIAALRSWPQQPGGRWWPMAADLDALARRLGERHAQAASYVDEARTRRRAKSSADRSTTPMGRTAEFVVRVGDVYARSWLRGGVNAMFGHDTIWTTGVGEDRLMRDHGALARQLSVRITTCPEARLMLARYCDARGLS